MMDQSLQTALRQIDGADLSAAQYRAARRLLDVAGQTGHVKLTKAHANERCATTTDGATRRLLGGLQQAGIIHYSVNGFVYIDFTAWSPMDKLTHPRTFAEQEWLEETDENLTADKKSDLPRALLDHESAAESEANLTEDKKSDLPRALLDRDLNANLTEDKKSDHGRALLDLPRALLDHNEAATYTHAHAGELVSLLDPNSSLEEDLTNKLTADPESQALSFALLTHIRVKPATLAKELAALHPLSVIREAASHWWFGRKSAGGQFEETPGVVVYWLKNWQSAGIPELSKHFYRTELYLNYRTRAEIEADRQFEAQLDAPRPAPSPVAPVATEPAPVADPHTATWAQVLAELKLTMQPTVYAQWVAGATVAGVNGNAWRITAPNAQALDYLNTQLSNKARRVLSALLKESVTVQFCLPEAKA